MWHTLSKNFLREHRQKSVYTLIVLCMSLLLLAGCSGAYTATTSSSTGSTNSAAMAPNSPSNAQHSAQGTSSGSTSSQYGPQYLVKSLQVTLSAQDTRQSATDLQQWIGLADPQSTTNGLNYSLVGENQYNVTLNFLIDVAHYNQVETYLRDYSKQKGNTLLSLQETVQDVTNDYVDTQARLTNLRSEQQRLLGFMHQAQNVNDAVSIEQQLSQVEGQIEDIEAHINELKGQTTFYNVTITLQSPGAPVVTPAPTQWSIAPIWQGAWSAVIGIWQVLVSMIVWLAALSIYIIPIIIIVWLVRRWRLKSVRAVPLSSLGQTDEPK